MKIIPKKALLLLAVLLSGCGGGGGGSDSPSNQPESGEETQTPAIAQLSLDLPQQEISITEGTAPVTILAQYQNKDLETLSASSVHFSFNPEGIISVDNKGDLVLEQEGSTEFRVSLTLDDSRVVSSDWVRITVTKPKTPIVNPSVTPLDSIRIVLDTGNLVKGQTIHYRVLGRYGTAHTGYSDADITKEVTIDSSTIDRDLIQINETTSEITALSTKTGTSTFKVSKDSFSASVRITVVEDPVVLPSMVAMGIVPENTVLGLNTTSINTAYGFDHWVSFLGYDLNTGDDISDQVIWRSSDPSLFTVDNKGEILTSASNTGTAYLTASNGSVHSDPIAITVTSKAIPVMTGLTVSLVNEITRSGDFVIPLWTLWQAKAIAHFDDGSSLDVTQSSTTRWRSLRESSLEVDNNVNSAFKGVLFGASDYYYSTNPTTSLSFEVKYLHNGVSKTVTKTAIINDPKLERVEVRSKDCQRSEFIKDMPYGLGTRPYYLCYMTASPQDEIEVNLWAIYDDGSEVDISAMRSIFSHDNSIYRNATSFNNILRPLPWGSSNFTYTNPMAIGEPLKVKLIESAAVTGETYNFEIEFQDREGIGNSAAFTLGFARIVVTVK